MCPSTICTQVPGANPQVTLPDNKLYAQSFPKGALPKIQSFSAALHSNKKDVLVVGGRYSQCCCCTFSHIFNKHEHFSSVKLVINIF